MNDFTTIYSDEIKKITLPDYQPRIVLNVNQWPIPTVIVKRWSLLNGATYDENGNILVVLGESVNVKKYVNRLRAEIIQAVIRYAQLKTLLLSLKANQYKRLDWNMASIDNKIKFGYTQDQWWLSINGQRSYQSFHETISLLRHKVLIKESSQ